MTRVSVIIPTLNRQKIVLDTLKDLSSQDYSNFEVLVVDQTDEVLADLEHYINANQKFKYMRLEKKSSPYARNVGAKAATGDILLFLDDDVKIETPHFIQFHLKNFRDSQIGMVGGRVVYANEQPHDKKVGRLECFGLKEITNFDSTVRGPIDHAPGGNMSVRKDIFFKVGGFSEIYLGNAHMEETDFSLRVKRAGYKAVFEPMAVLKHLQVPSGGNRAQDIYDFRYWLVKNFVVFYLKNYPKILFRFALPKSLFGQWGQGLRGEI